MTDTDTVELKPCLRCGAEPGHQSDGKSYVRYVCSKDCTTAHGNPENQEVWDRAATEWNTRIAALPPAVPQDDAFKAGQFAAADAIAKQCWHDGVPPKLYGTQRIKQMTDADVVERVAKAIAMVEYPKFNWPRSRKETDAISWDFAQTCRKHARAAIAALPPAVPDVTPDPAEAHVDGWRVRVIEWATDETVKVVQCKGELQAEKVEAGMGINMASEYYTEIDNKPRTTTITTTPDPVSEAAKVLLKACLEIQGMNTDDMTPAQERLDNLGRNGWADLRALTKDGEAG